MIQLGMRIEENYKVTMVVGDQSVRFCLGRWGFGRIGWVTGQDGGISQIKVNPTTIVTLHCKVKGKTGGMISGATTNASTHQVAIGTLRSAKGRSATSTRPAPSLTRTLARPVSRARSIVPSAVWTAYARVAIQ